MNHQWEVLGYVATRCIYVLEDPLIKVSLM